MYLHTFNLIPLTYVPNAGQRPTKERRPEVRGERLEVGRARRARSRIRTLRDDGEGTLPDDSAPMRAFQDSL